MPRVSPLQSNFDAGEFSPLLQARVDADRYKRGLAKCLNSISTLQGPVTRRCGSRYVSAIKTAANYTRLIPFKFSNTQAYMLEFGNTYIRFYANNAQVIGGYSFTVTAANATAGARYTNNGVTFTVVTTIAGGTTLTTTSTNAPTTSGTLTKTAGTGDATITFSSATPIPYEITSPYSTGFLPSIKFTQSLDVLYLVHPSFPPKKLQRFGSTEWVISSINFLDGPYLNKGLNLSVTSVTSLIHTAKLNVSAATGSITLTTQIGDYAALSITAMADNGSGEARITLANADEFADRSQVFVSAATGTTGANGTWVAKKISSTQYDLLGSVFNAAYTGSGVIAPAPFKSTDVGRLVRAKVSTNPQGYAKITAYTDGAHVTATVVDTFTAAGTTADFRLGTWADSTGYPSCVVFHDDRLFFGGSAGALQRIDGSITGDYENFAPTNLDTTDTISDSNAVSFSMASNDANVVNWMTSDERGMPVGTSGGPWIVRPSILNEAITAKNISAKRVNSVGAADLQAVLAGKSSIYLELSTRKIRELSYFYDIDGFRSVDLSEIAEHLPSVGIDTELVFQSAPQPIIWCGRADGVFLGMTYDRNLDALRTGWHKHILGGYGDVAGNPPVIESFAVIPSPDGTVDDVWFVVKRYINGATVRYIEYFNKIFEDFDAPEDQFFLDCGATFDNAVNLAGVTGTISNGNPASVYSIAHGLSTGDKVRFEGVLGMLDSNENAAINTTQFTITKTDNDNFTLNGFDASSLTIWVASATTFWRKQVTTISGLTWLEGQTVSLLGDGAELSNLVVTSGTITPLSFPSGVVQIGLNYSSELQQLRLEAGAADGTSLGKNRRINEAAVMVHRSQAFEIGVNFTNMQEVIVREPTDDLDNAPPLFTGIKDRIQLDSNYDTDNQICFRVNKPTAFTLLGVMPQQVTYDKG